MKHILIRFLNIRSVKEKEDLLLSVLPEKRVEKAKRFVCESDRLLSLGAGYLAYRYAGAYAEDAYGKPQSENLFFSLSHSGRFAAIAADGDRAVGLDIEKRREDAGDGATAEFCFDEEELRFYPQSGDLLPLYVSKESLAKAEGRGLSRAVKTVPALPLDGAVNYENKTYYRRSLQWRGYCVSVTLEGEDFTLDTEEVYVI